jgi:hypothetical protein
VSAESLRAYLRGTVIIFFCNQTSNVVALPWARAFIYFFFSLYQSTAWDHAVDQKVVFTRFYYVSSFAQAHRMFVNEGLSYVRFA